MTRVPERWVDRLLAAGIFAVATAELVSADDRRLPLAVDCLLLAAMVSPLLWRRRWPLASSCVALALGVGLVLGVPDVRDLNSVLFLLFVPAYTIGAHEPRRRAVAGLGACLVGPVVLNAATGQGIGSWAFSLGMCGASWATGRLLRARRRLAEDLRQTAQRLVVERDGRERLVLAEVRSRIARELQAVVASRVTGMVVQAEAADRVLAADPDEALAAMTAIEETGRRALSEMRQILGVLRSEDDGAALAPQPGVGQVPALVDRARGQRRRLALHVEGDPGTLPARVDLGVYRILEDVLTTAPADLAMEIRLRFDPVDVEIDVTPGGGLPAAWPTSAMRERVALCDGELAVATDAPEAPRLHVRLPRTGVHALV